MTELHRPIRYLTRQEINIPAWDACVEKAPNGLIYGRTFYLDAMAKNWSGLVLNDYEAVMPLVWNNKFGIHYLYQPYFTGTQGVYSLGLSPVDSADFLRAIPEKFKFWDIDLNEHNIIGTGNPAWQVRTRHNHFIQPGNYLEIQQRYRRLANRNIRKAATAGIQVEKNADPALVVKMYRDQYRKSHPRMLASDYERIVRFQLIARQKNLGDAYLAKSHSGEMLAYYLTLKDERFVYSLLGGSTARGKAQGAFHWLTDFIIREHADGKKIFRFEGSDVAGIAFFDSLFGAEKHPYLHVRMNALPFPLNLLK